ncbi:MBL fold metallo-hydrolase [Deinococcus radiomollis]|uniref:MBL fold metallo-hydrolase n=1 Tax=Deinococcus radiomollis TaxID=468916 RepID=UPI00389198F1
MPRLIDLNFQGVPGTIATYLLATSDGLALVDTGPSSTLPALQAGLAALGASLQDVRHLLLTHIHLDHAGAAGTLLAELPQARLYVHSRGAAHLMAPERLMASAAQIYGDQMDTLWGEMRPVSEAQMTVLEGGETFSLGDTEVTAIYTPGHAVHHLAYHAGPDLFVGDVGGIRLESRQSPRPPTPPPDIDLPAWAASIAQLRTVRAETLHLTHFGSYPHEQAYWDALERNIAADAGVVRCALEAGRDLQAVTDEFTEALRLALVAEGPELPERFALACPPWMSVQGLARYWKRAAARSNI